MVSYKIEFEVTGPLKTNCYLLYDPNEKEAALFDVARPIPKTEQNNLLLKLLFFNLKLQNTIDSLSLLQKNMQEIE